MKIRQVDDSAMCISRLKLGKGFSYYDGNGKRIIDKKTQKRIKKLRIPPMWKEVMICRFDNGHIQAIGRDVKNRKQYIYHSEYEKKRQEEKFKKLLDFSNLLPKIRKRALKDLKEKEWNLNKLTALIILLLDEYGIRIGNKEYKKRNDSYGLTTLRRKHLTIEEDELILSYKGKSNQEQEVHIDDEELISLIKKVAEQPGYEIFRYKDDNGKYHNVFSDDVNNYITRYMGNDFSSKDFRTWTANRMSIEFYPFALKEKVNQKRKKFSNILIGMVAEELGNTPSICREYYMHPSILNGIAKESIPHPNPFKSSKSKYGLSASEKLVQGLLGNKY